jgi:hypothetical protein
MASAASAQVEGEPAVWRDDRTSRLAAGTLLVGIGGLDGQGTLGEILLLKGGHDLHLWTLGDGDKAPALRPLSLAAVKDFSPVATGLEESKRSGGVGEHLAYCEALYKAYLTPVESFANSVFEGEEVTRGHLHSEPWKHRGKVIHLEGRLKRLRRFDPTVNVAHLGVKDLFEGWVFDENYGANPVAIHFTELPAGLAPAEKMDIPVAFDGYFFKIIRFASVDSKPGQAREAPLLIGRSPLLKDQSSKTPVAGSAAAPFLSWSWPMLGAVLLMVIATVGLTVGLSFWFRRGDRQVRSRLTAVMHCGLVAPEAEAPPPTFLTAGEDDPLQYSPTKAIVDHPEWP